MSCSRKNRCDAPLALLWIVTGPPAPTTNAPDGVQAGSVRLFLYSSWYFCPTAAAQLNSRFVPAT